MSGGSSDGVLFSKDLYFTFGRANESEQGIDDDLDTIPSYEAAEQLLAIDGSVIHRLGEQQPFLYCVEPRDILTSSTGRQSSWRNFCVSVLSDDTINCFHAWSAGYLSPSICSKPGNRTP